MDLQERVDAFVAEANGLGIEVRAEVEDDVITYHVPALTRLRRPIVRLARKHDLTIPDLEGA